MSQIFVEHASETIKNVRLVAHKPALKQCHMQLGTPNELVERPENGVSQLTVTTLRGQLVAWLYEIDETITDSYPYDEERTKALCTFAEAEISIHGDCGYSSVETVVAMTKFLHQQLFPADIGKWWFTRLDITRPFLATEASKFTIKFGSEFDHGKLTKSVIFSGTEQIGYIFFAAIAS